MTYDELMNCVNGIKRTDENGNFICHDFRNILSRYAHKEIEDLAEIFYKVVSATEVALELNYNIRIKFNRSLSCDVVQVITSYLDDMIENADVLKVEIKPTEVMVYVNFGHEFIIW